MSKIGGGEPVRFQPMRGCGTVRMQRIIHAFLEAFPELPPPVQQEIRDVIETTARGQAEGRALYAVLLRGKSPETASRETLVPVGRIYELRRAFYAAYRPI